MPKGVYKREPWMMSGKTERVRTGRKRKLDYDRIKNLYCEGCETLQNIGKILGCKHGAIQYALNTMGIKTRSRREPIGSLKTYDLSFLSL